MDADAICTNDVGGGFPQVALDILGIEALSLGEVITRLCRRFPDQMRQVHADVVASNRRLDEEGTLSKLQAAAGSAAVRAIRTLL